MFFKTPQNQSYPQQFNYNNQQDPYRTNNYQYSAYNQRTSSLDSISHPYPNMQTKPITYSATLDNLSSPRMHYHPTQPNFISQQPNLPQNIQRPVQHHIPPYNNYPQQFTSQVISPQILTQQRKGSFHMPQAISLGVAFGLFTLGFLSFLF